MMKLTDLGEKKIIKRLTSFLEIGDDTFCLRYGDGYLVLTTDMLYERTHILPRMNWERIGKLIVTVNLSDIAAMGAKPLAFLLSWGGPDMELEEFDRFIHCVDNQCKKYELTFAGGDTNQTDELILSGFCIGTAKKPVLRSTARVGDILAVTGSLGGAALGADILLKNVVYPGDECTDKINDVITKALEPQPRIKEGIFLGDYATAMTDISDSLTVSIHDIAEMSGVGIRLFPDRIPISDSTRDISGKIDRDVLNYALYGGGDYELLFTISGDDFKAIKDRINVTEIGEVTKENMTAIKNGKESGIEKRGYEHFVGI